MAKVMISMPLDLLGEFDLAAKDRHKRRSELLKELILQFLRGGKVDSVPDADAKARKAFEGLRQYTFSLGRGESAEGLIRKMRDSR